MTKALGKISEGITIILGKKAYLEVTEDGDTRLLPISKKVAEVLIANGFTYAVPLPDEF